MARYRNDPVFNRAVGMFRALFVSLHMTPSEAREALMLAAVLEEMERPSLSVGRMREFAEQLIRDQEGRGK